MKNINMLIVALIASTTHCYIVSSEERRTMHLLRESLSAAEKLYHHVTGKHHHHHEPVDSESTPVPVLDLSITDSSATAPAASPAPIELDEETEYEKSPKPSAPPASPVAYKKDALYPTMPAPSAPVNSQKSMEILKRDTEILSNFFETDKTKAEYRELFTAKEVLDLLQNIILANTQLSYLPLRLYIPQGESLGYPTINKISMLEDMIKKTIEVFENPTYNFEINSDTLEKRNFSKKQVFTGHMTLQAFLNIYIPTAKVAKKVTEEDEKGKDEDEKDAWEWLPASDDTPAEETSEQTAPTEESSTPETSDQKDSTEETSDQTDSSTSAPASPQDSPTNEAIRDAVYDAGNQFS